MRNAIIFLFASHLVPAFAESSDLNAISLFAKDVCDEIAIGGSIRREQVEGNLGGKVSGIAKLIGAEAEADGSLTVEEQTYEGIPYGDLPEQMNNARECRLELTKLLLQERATVAHLSARTASEKRRSAESIADVEVEIFRLEQTHTELDRKIKLKKQAFEGRSKIIDRLIYEKEKAMTEGRHEDARRLRLQISEISKLPSVTGQTITTEELAELEALEFEIRKKKELLKKLQSFE